LELILVGGLPPVCPGQLAVGFFFSLELSKPAAIAV
jgi:hypothetical protein